MRQRQRHEGLRAGVGGRRGALPGEEAARQGDAAFARACGEFARNDAFRSLNETIIANVGRDRDKGTMFARVSTGFETCAFCLMLASRGAVYHSRKTAGEWRHFHRGCDCKVVPSFEDDGTIKNLHVIHSDGIIETLNKKDAGLGS